MGRIILAVVLCGGLLTAQKVLLDGDADRQLAAFDVAALIGTDALSGPTAVDQVAGFLAGVSRQRGESLVALGANHVVAMGSPAWIGSVEAMLVHLREGQGDRFQLDLRVCAVTAAFAQGDLRDLLAQDGRQAAVAGAVPIRGVVGNDTALRLLKAIVRDPAMSVRQAPQITVHQLQAARIKVGKDIDYVRSFELEAGVDGQQTALPVADRVWHGFDATVVVGDIGRGTIGCDLQLFANAVDQPIRRFHADLPGVVGGAMVEVPRTKPFHGEQFAELADGSTAVMAAPNGEDWLLTTLSVQRIRPARPRPGAARGR